MTYSRKENCILELNISNLTPKHNLRNAILQILLSKYCIPYKKTQKKKKKKNAG